ncbi:beta-1,4-mannosyl-glycoprotein 4-beta-N-acetylglucosaminyltransferase [Lampetra planeri]
MAPRTRCSALPLRRRLLLPACVLGLSLAVALQLWQALAPRVAAEIPRLGLKPLSGHLERLFWSGHGGDDDDGPRQNDAADGNSSSASSSPASLIELARELGGRVFTMRDDRAEYFVRTPAGALCFREGSLRPEEPSSLPVLVGSVGSVGLEPNASSGPSVPPAAGCACRAGWHGRHCSVPSVVHHSNLGARHRAALAPRAVPRRVVNAVNVNHEMELLEARLHELNDTVDVFLVCESNFTAFGEARRLHFLSALLSGAFDFVRHKIHYVFLDHFPSGGRADGWIADEYLRAFATRDGLARLSGLRDDDVFVINDADELPSREALLFARLHDGWPEPFALHLRRSLYGFFWKQPGSLDVLAGSTVGALREVYGGNGIMLRRRHYYDMPRFRDYERRSGTRMERWSVGTASRHAGWHCSWCFPPEGVRTKLVSAQNGDFPRWGDYPEKLDMDYIKNLIRTGGWFDGTGAGILPLANPAEKMYAPWYVLENPKRFGHLLRNPYL